MTVGTSAPRTAHPIEQFVRVHHRTLEGWLQRKFGLKLTREDISDVLSETYKAALETEETRGFDGERMSAWTYQVARFRAIAIIRGRHGRVFTGDDELADHRDEPEDALSETLRDEEARRVTEALLRLPDDQREALQHVHVDGLTTRAAAELLGTSKSTFNRLYQRALGRLQSLCAAEQGADCAHARALLAAKAPLIPELAGWRDAHLEGCFACQVAGGRRVRIVAPVVALPGALSRLMDRAGAFVGRGLPSEAVAAGVGGTAGGGALIGGVAIKAAACVVAAAAACAGAPLIHADDAPRPVHRVTHAAPRASAPTAPAVAAAAAARVTQRAAVASAVKAAQRRSAARRRATSKARPRASATVAPRSAPAPSPAAAATTSAAPASAAPAPAVAAKTPSAPPVSPPSRSSFAEEFRP